MGSTVDDLLAVLPADRVLTDPDLLAGHRRDEADLCAAGTPLAVVRPQDTAEVVAAVRAAAAHGVPVVPQGARTGLAGAANAVDGAIVLSLTGMDRILEIDPGEPDRGGAAGRRQRRHCAAPPPRRASPTRRTPARGSPRRSAATSSTNAGGMCCVKYGVTGEYVLGMEVVLADGEVLRCGRRTVKGVAGYDLTGLFVGSEGTLGIITEITVAAPARGPDGADPGGGVPDDGGRGRGGVRGRPPPVTCRACWSCSTARTCGRSRRTSRWAWTPRPRRCCWSRPTPVTARRPTWP